MFGRTSIRFLVSNALSLLGNSIAAVALPLILLATTGDALAAGTLALICAVPQMAIGIVGGAALDRFNRRTISIASDLVSAASIALIPIVDMIWGLNFWWFVALGLLGAVGDIPGMTARDALLPAVTKHDDVDLQRFMGLSQSLDSLVTIVGPALAALSIGLVGGVPSLWFTAALSFSAALATATIPRCVGAVRSGAPANEGDATAQRGVVPSAVGALRTGIRVLFRTDGVLTVSTLLTFGIVMVMGSFQGLVLPVFFTDSGRPELLGYVLSMFGMLLGVAILGALPPYPFMLLGALVLGVSAGPASALLGFFMLDRIPEASRGSALGTQNSLLLAAAPVAVFATSVAAIVLVGCWMAITAFALVARGMRNLDDAAPDPKREEGALEEARLDS